MFILLSHHIGCNIFGTTSVLFSQYKNNNNNNNNKIYILKKKIKKNQQQQKKIIKIGCQIPIRCFIKTFAAS